jgi:hypothetical protein
MKIGRSLSPAFRSLDQVEEEGSFRAVTSACGDTTGMFDPEANSVACEVIDRIPLFTYSFVSMRWTRSE